MRHVQITLACVLATLSQANAGSVRLNQDAVTFSRELIEHGRLVADRHSEWRWHKPSAAQENDFIHAHGFAEYAKWHLAIDESHPADSKAHYKFPFGDFIRVHRCGLLAVKARAHQYGYREMETAAEELLAALQRAANQPRPATAATVHPTR